MSYLKLHRDSETPAEASAARFGRRHPAAEQPESYKFPTDAVGRLHRRSYKAGDARVDPVIVGVEAAIDDMGQRLKALRAMFETPEGPRAA